MKPATASAPRAKAAPVTPLRSAPEVLLLVEVLEDADVVAESEAEAEADLDADAVDMTIPDDTETMDAGAVLIVAMDIVMDELALTELVPFVLAPLDV